MLYHKVLCMLCASFIRHIYYL